MLEDGWAASIMIPEKMFHLILALVEGWCNQPIDYVEPKHVPIIAPSRFSKVGAPIPPRRAQSAVLALRWLPAVGISIKLQGNENIGVDRPF